MALELSSHIESLLSGMAAKGKMYSLVVEVYKLFIDWSSALSDTYSIAPMNFYIIAIISC